jgi:hypothetical protein
MEVVLRYLHAGTYHIMRSLNLGRDHFKFLTVAVGLLMRPLLPDAEP